MKKIFYLFLVILFSGIAQTHAVYFDIGLTETPVMLAGVDVDDNEFWSFFNVAQLRASLNVNDNLAFRFRLTHTYLDYTNSANTASNRLKAPYIDRANVKYGTDRLGLTLGRDVFSEHSGMLLGNLSDGLFFKSRFARFEQRAYIMYSGWIPTDVNNFNVTSQDRAEGAERLQTGLFLTKYGVLIKSLGVGVLYSADQSTNQDHYNPLFLNANASGKFGSIVHYGINFAYSLGQFSSNVNNSALAFDVQMQLNFKPEFALITRVAYAGGDDTNSTNVSENFNGLGVYNTGQVLAPDFSNLLIFHVGALSQLMQGKLQLGLNFLYMLRLTGDDLGTFYTGSGTVVGKELALTASWKFDPNMTLLATGGYFWKGDAFDPTDIDLYKVIGAIQFKF